MPIQTDATTEELSSPFFKNYERIADAWNDVARTLGGSVDGVYNAYHLEATLVCRIGEQEVTAKGTREMMPPAFKLANSRYVGQTIIAVQGDQRTIGTFKILRRSLLARIIAVLQGRSVGYSSDGSFLIEASDRGLLDWIIGKHVIIDQLITYGLRSMALHHRGELVLHFDDLIEKSADLQEVLRLASAVGGGAEVKV